MFAVKGWSVDATSLKPQTELFKTAKSSTEDGEQKRSRKRKRREGQTSQDVDVGKLWDQHIEGKAPAKKKSAKHRERKKQKLQNDEEGASQKNRPGSSEKSEIVGETERWQDIDLDPNAEKRKQKRKKQKSGGAEKGAETTAAQSDVAKPLKQDAHLSKAPSLPATAKLTPMQSAMRQKLVSARFRHLNETLYTAPSVDALKLFDQNPEMFEDYHAGFRQQVAVWPENPVDTFVSMLRSRGKVKPPSYKGKKGKAESATENTSLDVAPLPRTQGTSIIADLGCGDARLAQTLKDSGNLEKLNLKFHSFDLHSPSPLVTKADIANLPLSDGSVDIAIFCLALMGTNWISFIEEAYRILHWKGELWIAEIKSRFGRMGRKGKPVEHSVGSKKKQAALKKVQEAKQKEGEEVNEAAVLRMEVDGVEAKPQEETNVEAFVGVLKRRGFVLKDGNKSVDLGNKMFVRMEFMKATTPTKGKGVPKTEEGGGGMKPKKKFVDEAADEVATDDEAKVLKPCLYKVR